jgi:hypothetical protein
LFGEEFCHHVLLLGPQQEHHLDHMNSLCHLLHVDEVSAVLHEVKVTHRTGSGSMTVFSGSSMRTMM